MNNTEKKAELLASYVNSTTDSTLKRDFRLLKTKYEVIEGGPVETDPFIEEVFSSPMCDIIRSHVGAAKIRLSECPGVSELSDLKGFGKKSIDKFMIVMEEYGLNYKLK